MKNIKVEKGLNTSNPNVQTDYRAVFTGECLFTIEAVNPTREELIEIKNLQNIEDRIPEQEYTNIGIKGEDFTKIEFLLSFDPSEYLGDNGEYTDKYFVSYPVFINSNLNLNKTGDKVEVIDQHNQACWVPYRGNTTPSTLLNEYISTVEQSGMSDSFLDYLKRIDTSTLRFAKRGETNLYDFIFKATVLPRHGSTIKDENGEETAFSLDNFVIGGNPSPEAASQAFDRIVEGDVSYIKEVFESDICKYSDGTNTRIGGLLGVRVNNNNPQNVKFYQEVFTSPIEICTFRESARPRVWKRDDNGMPLHETRLSKSAYLSLVSEDYPWRHEWQDSMIFQPFNKDSYKKPETTEVPIGNKNPLAPSDDDLPF